MLANSYCIEAMRRQSEFEKKAALLSSNESDELAA